LPLRDETSHLPSPAEERGFAQKLFALSSQVAPAEERDNEKLRKNFPLSTFNFPFKKVDNRGKYNLDS